MALLADCQVLTARRPVWFALNATRTIEYLTSTATSLSCYL